MKNAIFLIVLLSSYFLLLGYGVYQFKFGEELANVEIFSVEEFSAKQLQFVHGVRQIKWSLIAIGIAFVSLIPFMGMPGAIFISGLTKLGLFNGPKKSHDWFWPLSIYISLVLPLCIPLSVVVIQFGEVRSIEWLVKYGVHLTVFLWLVFMGFYPKTLVRILALA